jgi:hypothetical protein
VSAAAGIGLLIGVVPSVQADAAPPQSYLSDLSWTSATSGWGPVEKDRSNGEAAAGDGHTLTLNSATYQKGLGAHAFSDIRYTIPSGCTTFKSDVGVDDEVAQKGSVRFQVYVDSTRAYDSGTMTGASQTKSISLDVTGRKNLRLFVTNGGDNIDFDHADWAAARLECPGVGGVQPSISITSAPPSSTSSTTATIAFQATNATQIDCQLDSGAWSSCTSPASYGRLGTGPHTFTAKASNGQYSASAGASWTVASAAPPLSVSPPSPVAPPPTISGTVAVGQTLAVSTGGWNGTQPLSYAYSWLRCDSAGANCTAISGATASAYTISSADSGSRLEASVTASNSAGTAAATSAATQAVPSPTPAAPTTATPPTPPSPYSLPAGALWVTSASDLTSALANNQSRDIVLRNGVYDSSGPFDDYRGNHLYAESLGGAVLKAGLILGGNWGPGGGSVQGVAFDVSSSSKTLQNSIIHVWGTGKNSKILDVTLEGHNAVGSGILTPQVEGLVIRRVVATHFVSYGLKVDANIRNLVVATPPIVTDVDASYVSWATPQASNGTAEACVWIGNTATVQRIRAHDCAWEGLEAATAASGATFEDITVYNNTYSQQVGIYFEHFVSSSVLRRAQIGPNVRIGLMCEWADPAWGSKPACTDNVIEQSYFDTRLVGVNMDEGTVSTTVRSSTFVNQCWAAIGNYKGVGNLWDTTANNYNGLKPGAVQISTNHYYTGTCA